jgi:sterol desaturase/sphingolipid hydroxylase (fatty acid hydroxylase superfamily)
VRLTVVEEVIDVMCSIAALRLLGAHPLSRCAYNVVITFLLVELHCGYDLPWQAQNVVPGAVVGGSRRHHLHHARGGAGHYQKFFTYLDDGAAFLARRWRAMRTVGPQPAQAYA